MDKSDGLEDKVGFTYDECLKMRDATVTHNHPGGTTFSTEDVDLLVKWDAGSIRATSTEVTYQLSRLNKPGTKDSKSFAADFKTAKEKFETKLDVEWNKYDSLWKRGLISRSEIDEKADELNARLDKFKSDWLKRHSKSYGYRYSVFRKRI